VIKRAVFLLVLGAVVSVCDGTGSSPPNILLISVDSLRPDHLGAYGYSRPTSPSIDRLAKEGVLFETVTSSSSWTLPAHASLFTSLPDSIHGAETSQRKLGEQHETLAERLRESGYKTVGLWGGPLLSPEFGFARGFDSYIGVGRQSLATPGIAAGPVAVSHQDVTGMRVLRGVEDQLRGLRTETPRRPFFLFVHLWDTHYDYLAPEPHGSKFNQGYLGPINGRNLADLTHGGSGVVSDPDIQQLRTLYDQEVSWVDEQIGRILHLLETLGLTKNTIVAVTADHGEEFYEHGSYGHRRKLFEESIRIPLVLRYPGEVPAGKRVKVPAHIVDIAPTLLDLAGLSPMAAATGLSMVPAFDSIEGVDRDFTVSELAHEDGPKLMAVRGRDWKILLNPKTRSIKGFWDLGEDPEETRDLVATQPDRMASKMQLLERALATVSVDEELSGAPASDLPDNIRRELQSLGYLGASEVQTNRPVPSFEAVPNPIPACDGSGTGITTLSWAAPASVEVRVGSATGKLMAVGAPTGTATTGRWVRQGTRFVLLDRATKQPIAETTVALTFLGCD